MRHSLQFLGLMGDEAPEWAVPKGFDFMDYVDALKASRRVAMETKDFAIVDRLKSGLLAAGVEVRITKDSVDLLPGPNFDPSKLDGLL